MYGKKSKEEAVSPVIGVILMVAITVVLAATIAMFAFGSTDKIGTNKVVALQGSANDEDVAITLNGGADIVSLSAMKFKWDGSLVTGDITANKKTVTLGADGILWANVTVSDNDVFEGQQFHVGDTVKLPNSGGKFQVVGVFADNTEQVIYEKSFVGKKDDSDGGKQSE